LSILEKYVNNTQRFLIIIKAQANARIVCKHDEDEHKDIISILLKVKDSITNKYFIISELIFEAVLLLIADK